MSKDSYSEVSSPAEKEEKACDAIYNWWPTHGRGRHLTPPPMRGDTSPGGFLLRIITAVFGSYRKKYLFT
jgi:hypothetical protein